ncbi:MAG: hypothetical protein JSW11_22015 [Candidatus Heimdallarchaeota archaeon]|nr:MAG: hypothetical protein JSW11_22015 [Candidatus Heimdallarchaeota archaeon]
MDNIETETKEEQPPVHVTTELLPDLLSTMTPSDLNSYLQIKRQKQGLMRDIPLSKLFFLFERETTLNVISHQVHLSETIELIAGILVSEDIRQYRGLLLNMERTAIYFYLFYWIFRFLNNFKSSRLALESYSSFWFFFEFLWKLQFPWGLIRPGAIPHPIIHTQIPEIQKSINIQQKHAWKIAKSIEKKTTTKKTLKEVKNLTLDVVKKTGITGPFARASGTTPPSVGSSSFFKRKSAQDFLKYTYATENNLLNVLRVSYTELILSLDQISRLLKEYSIVYQETSNFLNGEATTSFSTTLGESHLTLNILDNQVTYFNFIPPQMLNITGVVESLSTCPSSLQSVILLFFDPEFIINLG